MTQLSTLGKINRKDYSIICWKHMTNRISIFDSEFFISKFTTGIYIYKKEKLAILVILWVNNAFDEKNSNEISIIGYKAIGFILKMIALHNLIGNKCQYWIYWKYRILRQYFMKMLEIMANANNVMAMIFCKKG